MKLFWVVGGREGGVIKINWNGGGGGEKRVEWLTARFLRVFSISNSNSICFFGKLVFSFINCRNFVILSTCLW